MTTKFLLVLRETKTMGNIIADIKKEIEHYENLLKTKGIQLTEQTWIELQVMELKKQLKTAKKEAKNNLP